MSFSQFCAVLRGMDQKLLATLKGNVITIKDSKSGETQSWLITPDSPLDAEFASWTVIYFQRKRRLTGRAGPRICNNVNDG